MRKLNFGCGSIQPEGWDNIDMEDFGQRFVGGFEILESDTYDIVVAHCALQINGYNEYEEMLKNFLRILKRGGVLRVSLPDIEAGFEALQAGDKDWFPNGETNLDDKFSNWLTWYSTSKSLLTPQAMINRLHEAGFYEAHQAQFGETWYKHAQSSPELDDRKNEVYFVEAIK